MSDMFSLILNNPVIKVNSNTVSGKCTINEGGHTWVNTLIENKVYENCLTKGCTTAIDGKGNVFTKLGYIYLEEDNFKIQKALGLPLEYSEIPNTREDLLISIKLKKLISNELKNKNNIYYKDYIITKIAIIKKDNNKLLMLDKKNDVFVLKSLWMM